MLFVLELWFTRVIYVYIEFLVHLYRFINRKTARIFPAFEMNPFCVVAPHNKSAFMPMRGKVAPLFEFRMVYLPDALCTSQISCNNRYSFHIARIEHLNGFVYIPQSSLSRFCTLRIWLTYNSVVVYIIQSVLIF